MKKKNVIYKEGMGKFKYNSYQIDTKGVGF